MCKLWTYALGWELRPEISGDLQRSEVFRSQDGFKEVVRDVMSEKGFLDVDITSKRGRLTEIASTSSSSSRLSRESDPAEPSCRCPLRNAA